ncbi:dihydroorotate oxidase [Candidatus Woesearchaeota archaeon]|nr:dihydroorotate oxidase [Candidatus Woesearchaeota archaeon]
MDISCAIGGKKLPSLIMNASGPLCTMEDHLRALCQSSSGAVVTKSMTIEPRDGNPHPKYADLEYGSVNSNGLENLGVGRYMEVISKLKKEFPDCVFIASVAGLKEEDYYNMAAEIGTVADLIEVNLSCPNIPGKPQIAYDMEASDRILKTINTKTQAPIGVKLPAYCDPVFLKEAADMLMKHELAYLSLINSIGHTVHVDPLTDETVIHPNNGRGGLGGAYIKPIALGQVHAFYQLLGNRIPILGVGGVYTGRDVYDYVLAGATGVQVGTAYMQEGPAIFTRIAQELRNVLAEKGARSAQEKLGMLKIRGVNT